MFAVSDTGIGIKKENFDKILNLFGKPHENISESYGAGLG